MIFQNLNAVYNEFISNAQNEVIIFCPYIQVSSLKLILERLNKKLSIVTTWKTADLLSGISSLELYPYCKSLGIYLYVNQNIHLKVLCDSYHSALVGSANITGKALGTVSQQNHECVVLYDGLDRSQQIYLRSILQESTLINDEEYARVSNIIMESAKEFQDKIYTNVDFSKAVNKEFLISSLPMSINIDTFFDYYSEKLTSHGFADVDYDCAVHDLALYNIRLGLNRATFNKELKKAFFGHPFIQELRKFIHKDRYFGEIKEWVQKTCIDVPVPSRRDLTGNVQV
ncbi:MAG: phospholipase D-like domain-containing protein, partial [Nitrosotalea sp.]